MKTLVENSIIIKGHGLVKASTIFTTEDRSDSKYFDISELAGKRLNIEFSYTEGEALKKSSVVVTLDREASEMGARDAILSAIQAELV